MEPRNPGMIGRERRMRPASVNAEWKGDDLDLREFTLCVNRSGTASCSIEMTRNAWKFVDEFITSHRFLPESAIGLRARVSPPDKIDDFIKRCEETSSLYRDLFLNPGQAGAQRHEFFRALHAHFEQCLLELSALHPERGLSGTDMHHAAVVAHNLRSGIGHVLVQMEAFEALSQSRKS